MALPSREAVTARIEATLDAMVGGSFGRVPVPDATVRPHLDTVLLERRYTVRDGVLVLLAMQVEHGGQIDWRHQELYNPARAASRDLEGIYARLHIAGSKEALQTGYKGINRYIDRRNTVSQAVLAWASEQSNVDDAFHYLAAGIARTARNLPAMPALDTPRLTFPAVFALLDELLARPSGGAYEQFAFAALLDAWRQQLGEPGVVETKHLNASDASAGTAAADVQERYRGQVTEAYEVTAAGWASKLSQAQATLARHDLARAHIVAAGAAAATGDAIAAAVPKGLDVTVRDLREEVRSMLARLGKPHRRAALERLYDLLVTNQSDDALVVALVAGLEARGLTAP